MEANYGVPVDCPMHEMLWASGPWGALYSALYLLLLVGLVILVFLGIAKLLKSLEEK